MSHRTHEDQIKKIAQSLKAPFQIRKNESGACEVSGIIRTEIKQPIFTNANLKQRQKFHDSPTVNPETRCIRCHARVSAMDSHYTNMTGLCISCWESDDPGIGEITKGGK